MCYCWSQQICPSPPLPSPPLPPPLPLQGRFTPNFSNLSLSDDAFCAALGFFLLMVGESQGREASLPPTTPIPLLPRPSPADWAVVLWFTVITVNLIINTLFLKRTEKLEL